MRFQEIQRHWYERLRDEGFRDIEVRGGDGCSYRSLYHGAPQARAGVGDLVRYESQGEYYRKAGWFLHDYSFQTDEERLIWSLYCEGVPYRDMEVRVGKSASTICRTLKRILDGPFREFLKAKLSTDLYDDEEVSA